MIFPENGKLRFKTYILKILGIKPRKDISMVNWSSSLAHDRPLSPAVYLWPDKLVDKNWLWWRQRSRIWNLISLSRIYCNVTWLLRVIYLSKQCKSPCIYTFCGGSCALFSANGYRLLLNGGKKDESVFWRYVTHVPRLDAIIGIDTI